MSARRPYRSFFKGLALTFLGFGLSALVMMWTGDDEARDWTWWWVPWALVAIPWAWAIILACRHKPWFAFSVGAGLPWVALIGYILIALSRV